MRKGGLGRDRMALNRVVAQGLRVLGEERGQRTDVSEGRWGEGKGDRERAEERGDKEIFCVWMGALRDSFRVHRPSWKHPLS